MSLLTGTYLLIAGRGGLVFVTFLCVTFVVLPRPVVSAPLMVALCAAVILLPEYVAAWDVTGQQWIIGTPALLISLAMCGVRANAVTQIALFQARAEVEQLALAAERERLRIVRDLHDLLGHSLTTVVVKAELALRLVKPGSRPGGGGDGGGS
jgi:two-component system, NarL family, sensor histidine kinase DesK